MAVPCTCHPNCGSFLTDADPNNDCPSGSATSNLQCYQCGTCNLTRCSGTLVAPQIVLTAKHCRPSGPGPCDQTTIWGYRFRRQLPSQGGGVGQVDFNDDCSDDCSDDQCVESADQGASSFFHVRVACFIDIPDYDLTLAILEQPVTHIEPIPVKFLTPAELPQSSRILLAGWGVGAPDSWGLGTPCPPNEPTHKLKVVKQRVDTHTSSGGITWLSACATPPPPGVEGHSQTGDSGGPILIETCHGLAVVGVISQPFVGVPAEVVNGNPNCIGLTRCIGDVNEDGTVDGIDLGLFLNNWGNPGCGGSQPCLSDLDCDGDADGTDLGNLLFAWGVCDQPVTGCCESLMAGGQGELSMSDLPVGTPDFSSLLGWISQASYEELVEWYLNGMPIPSMGGQ